MTAAVVASLCCGCGSGGGKAFLDQKKEIGPRLEWSREITSKSGGTIRFRVTSQGPFGLTVVTDKGYKAIQGDRKALSKEDVLLTTDSKASTYEGNVALPPGSSWFIIENQTDGNAELRLQCFAP